MRPQAGIRPATPCSVCNPGKPKRESAQHRRPGVSGVPGQQSACSTNWYSAVTGGYIQDGRAPGKREGKLAKIVIIGGGVIGSSIAYHLAQAGDASDVVVVEPDPTYEFAATPRATGGIRQLYTVPENIRMSQYGHEIYGQFETLMAVDGEPARIDFHRAGYLWLGWAKRTSTR